MKFLLTFILYCNKTLAAVHRTRALTDYSVHDTLTKRYKFRVETVLADGSLTDDERSKAKDILTYHL